MWVSKAIISSWPGQFTREGRERYEAPGCRVTEQVCLRKDLQTHRISLFSDSQLLSIIDVEPVFLALFGAKEVLI